MTKEQIAKARKSLEAYWAGSISQSVRNDYATGRYVEVNLDKKAGK